MVYQLSLADGASGVADGVAVLDDILALCNIAKGKLMTCRDAGTVGEGHGNGVCRMDL